MLSTQETSNILYTNNHVYKFAFVYQDVLIQAISVTGLFIQQLSCVPIFCVYLYQLK